MGASEMCPPCSLGHKMCDCWEDDTPTCPAPDDLNPPEWTGQGTDADFFVPAQTGGGGDDLRGVIEMSSSGYLEGRPSHDWQKGVQLATDATLALFPLPEDEGTA